MLINGKYQERILPPFIPGGEFSGGLWGKTQKNLMIFCVLGIVLEVADDVDSW